jgi:hypothetical protein
MITKDVNSNFDTNQIQYWATDVSSILSVKDINRRETEV